MADGGLIHGAQGEARRRAAAALFSDEADEAPAPAKAPCGTPMLAPMLALSRRTPAAQPALQPAPQPQPQPQPQVLAAGIAAAGLVETAEGLVPAEELAPGDRIITRDRGMQPITRVALVQPAAAIRIARNAFGPGLPARDLLVAPGHRFFLRSERLQRQTGRAEVLVAAGDMQGLPGIEAAPAAGPAVQLWCARHELVRVEGLWCETAPEAEVAPVRHALPSCLAREVLAP